ncbi:ribosomal protein S18 acetylase RimI-like enzyme [Alkalihalobacillus xiaoxiensis]|uniref:Ribosomal protein S18 acetylase RimI-like enzyme n=1 Tax=Shouchella xiaoxiensis TaxID=766895 RepID=A0ABS2SZ17_9BACI|nr:GNAT family N-acetyltransferase [Shouchella xiaoxiensis]MBM7840015.1 ribosomal protein S18 acetylase RimI-like enzyme [Shouchella xiaoxiensis]
MIKRIDIQVREVAEQIYQLQRKSYQVEAELIQFECLRPLVETIEQLRSTEEIFFSYVVKGQIIGAISIERNKTTIDICRLMVDPSYFRRGIARQLLQHIESSTPSIYHYSVSTGAANKPAIKLYESVGFCKQSFELKEGLLLVHLHKYTE